MIKNERQYRITKAAARKFQEALSTSASETTADIDPIIVKATERALSAQLSDLEASLRDYDSLRSGAVQIVEVDSLDELPALLIRARIASGLTQKELAERMGLSAQQIQRYEESDYQSASFSRLLEVAKALDLNIRHEALVGATEETVDRVLATLANLGLPKEFITRRLSVPAVDYTHATSQWLGSLLDQVRRVYGWEPSDVLAGSKSLSVDSQPGFSARFKVAKGRNEKRLSAYTVYAHYLAMLLIEQLPEVEPEKLPNTAENFYDAVAVRYETVTFTSVLQHIWSLGIGVIPLSDKGSFDGSYWRVGNRHVIALKPNTSATARWMFDLLHDYFHATQHPDRTESAIIELPPNDLARIEDPDELEASKFASDVSVAGQGESIWDMAAAKTEGKLQRLKAALPNVAQQHGVEVGAAAYYMAHRLMEYGENWWGAAANLQRNDEQPWQIARDILLQNINLQTMAPTDRKLFQIALQE